MDRRFGLLTEVELFDVVGLWQVLEEEVWIRSNESDVLEVLSDALKPLSQRDQREVIRELEGQGFFVDACALLLEELELSVEHFFARLLH